MSELTPGTTFTSGQLVTSEILNRLVNDATLNDGIIKARHMSEDGVENIISGHPTLLEADLENEDLFLVWDVSTGSYKKITKDSLQNKLVDLNLVSNGLVFDSSNPTNSAIDLSGITTGKLIDHEKFQVMASGATFIASDEYIYIGECNIKFLSESRILRIGDPWMANPNYTFQLQARDNLQIADSHSFQPNQDGDTGVLRLAGRSSTGDLKTWFFQASPEEPQLFIAPETNMYHGTSDDPDQSEPRIVLRGDVYIQDFDDVKSLPIKTDSTKAKLFVDEIYNMEGVKLLDHNGAINGGSGGTSSGELSYFFEQTDATGNPLSDVEYIYSIAISAQSSATSAYSKATLAEIMATNAQNATNGFSGFLSRQWTEKIVYPELNFERVGFSSSNYYQNTNSYPIEVCIQFRPDGSTPNTDHAIRIATEINEEQVYNSPWVDLERIKFISGQLITPVWTIRATIPPGVYYQFKDYTNQTHVIEKWLELE